MQWEVNAAHILIKVDPMTPPRDTLLAFNKLDSIRRLVTDSRSFSILAKQNSQDGSARRGGDLGWFTAFHMVSPFEDTAYALNVGEVSQVFRTRFGFHILMLNDKRATKGKIRVSHIYFAKNIHGNALARQKARIFYDSIQSGASWNLIAQSQSDDQRTRGICGMLPLAGIRQLPDDFFSAIYKLQNEGDISEPFETSTGWHIAKLEEVEPLLEYEIKKDEIAYLLKRSGRNEYTEEEVIRNLKSEFGYIQNFQDINLELDRLSSQVDNFIGKVAFTYENVKVLWQDFIQDAELNTDSSNLKKQYQQFETQKILAIENSLLGSKYPEYGFLLQEFEEGLLLFEVLQKKVWEIAYEDSVGLKKFFEMKAEKYTKPELNGQIISTSESNLDALFEQVKSKTKFSRSDLVTRFNGGELKIAKPRISAIEIPNFESENIGKNTWIKLDNKRLMFIDDIIRKPTTLEQSRGLVMADFQDYLTSEWVFKLKDKRRIKIFDKKLRKLINR